MLFSELQIKRETFEDLAHIFFLSHFCYIEIFLLHLGSQSTSSLSEGLTNCSQHGTWSLSTDDFHSLCTLWTALCSGSGSKHTVPIQCDLWNPWQVELPYFPCCPALRHPSLPATDRWLTGQPGTTPCDLGGKMLSLSGLPHFQMQQQEGSGLTVFNMDIYILTCFIF